MGERQRVVTHPGSGTLFGQTVGSASEDAPNVHAIGWHYNSLESQAIPQARFLQLMLFRGQVCNFRGNRASVDAIVPVIRC